MYLTAEGKGHAGAYHVQVDVDEAAGQVFAGLDGGGVIPVLPEGNLGTLSPVVGLPNADARITVRGDDNSYRAVMQSADAEFRIGAPGPV